ncbi:MAG: ATP-binding protein [Roseburia sp.]
MEYICPILMFCGGTLAAYFAVNYIMTQDMRYYMNRIFCLLCILSSLWSFGFGGVFLQETAEAAFRWRAVGMIGTFGYLISAVFLVCHLLKRNKLLARSLQIFSCFGVVLYFFVTRRDQVIFHREAIGMTYYFKAGLWNNLYIAYSVILAVTVVIALIRTILFAESKRMQVFGKRFLIAVVILATGMIFDTVMPLLGVKALPGSSIAQFICVAVLFYSMNFLNRSHINIANMSEFIYESLAVPVLVYDADRNLQIANDTAMEFLHIVPNSYGDPKNDLEELFSMEGRAFDFEGHNQMVEAICRRSQAYCHLSVSKIFDSYHDLIGYIIIANDQSEQVRTMQRLEEARREADEANRAKSTFLANMSHEIRTPMNAVMGFSELILKEELDPKVREYVQDIRRSSQNLLALINEILDISKIESGKMELVNNNYYTANLLNDVSVIVSNQAREKGLEFKMILGKDIPCQMYGDKIRLREIMINLLNNAIKYTETGTITLDIDVLEKTPNQAYLKIAVSDTGIGIRQEDQENLFQKFTRIDQRIHHDIEGSGLGLAIVKGYVTLMGGRVMLDSTYGKGSTFTVLLNQKIIDATPVNFESSHADNNQESSIGSMFISDIDVLVVDDNKINLKLAKNTLSAYGLHVDVADNGADAIEMCKEKKYQMAFIDQMMPEMDGIETMKAIRKTNDYYGPKGDGKIIVLTADAVIGARERLLNEGFDEYLGKPMNFRQLERLFLRFLPKDKIRLEQAALDTKVLITEEDILYLKGVLPQVDLEYGLQQCGGGLQDYLKILQIIHEYGPKQIRELGELWMQHNVADYTTKVHSMKSTVRSIGAMELGMQAEKLELAGKSGDEEYIRKNRQSFDEKYQELMVQVEDVLMHYAPAEDSAKKDKEKLDDQMAEHVLTNIRQCVEDFDFTHIFDILEELNQYEMPENYRELFEKIRQLMDVLDVDALSELLEME